MEANVWGMLFFATELEEHRNEFKGMHFYQCLGNLLVFLRYASISFPKLGYSGPVHIEMRMNGMRGVRWIYSTSGFPEGGPSSELDDEIQFPLQTETDELIKTPDRLAINILRYVFYATNCLM